ncbi:hypothetical protein, partial [Pseudomonas sp. MF6768]|uniref:hypothetical protein n=1 Tax=Pseudomonas sp. MF6768 TaxID=2797532 RepID=UPI001E3C204F
LCRQAHTHGTGRGKCQAQGGVPDQMLHNAPLAEISQIKINLNKKDASPLNTDSGYMHLFLP